MNLSFTPHHDFLIAIDSDGCVFDTMEVKQTLHFHPLILEHWGLWPMEQALREMAERVNLHSSYRGSNRFVALAKTFELLRTSVHPEDAGVTIPDPAPLQRWIDSGVTLTNDHLAEAAETDAFLGEVLAWSRMVNRDIAENMQAIPPFPEVRKTMAAMHHQADLMVVSLTPHAALAHEWDLHGLEPLVNAIAGLEAGTKPVQLRRALEVGGYDPEKVLLIGDAPGDLKAARECGVNFFPTVPGRENTCWRELRERDLALFFAGEYRGAVEDKRIQEFEGLLPDPD